MTIYIIRTGIPHLPLHSGPAPRSLFTLMVRLAREVLGHVVSEYGAEEVLRRLSDPFWCQAFGCLLGFDCHSSGVTATTGGAVKEAVKGLEHDFGFAVAGGKGATAGWTPVEITAGLRTVGLLADTLVSTSRLVAKFDSAAVQDGYQRYHQCFSLP